MKSHKEHDVQTADFFVSLLDRVPNDRANRQLTPRGWDNWQYICMFYLRAFTQTIVKAAADLMQYRDAAPIGLKDHRIAVLKAALQGAPELTWGIIGEALLSSEGKYRFWPLRSLDIPKRDQSDTVTLLESVNPDILYKWVDSNKPIAAQTIAQYIHVEQTPLPALARELLIRYGDDKVVRQHLHPSSRGGVWSGSYTDRLQKMLEVVRSWLTDENEIVRNWAADIADDIEEAIQKRKPYDDEEDLIYRQN